MQVRQLHQLHRLRRRPCLRGEANNTAGVVVLAPEAIAELPREVVRPTVDLGYVPEGRRHEEQLLEQQQHQAHVLLGFRAQRGVVGDVVGVLTGLVDEQHGHDDAHGGGQRGHDDEVAGQAGGAHSPVDLCSHQVELVHREQLLVC